MGKPCGATWIGVAGIVTVGDVADAGDDGEGLAASDDEAPCGAAIFVGVADVAALAVVVSVAASDVVDVEEPPPQATKPRQDDATMMKRAAERVGDKSLIIAWAMPITARASD
ncbi:hypothetical protein [Noviherbaspirillum saxi]|uniref:hypothetical protein n=1 Tax=Noviherbaspirillum saxi TaxID=2320863 RepID=UPI001313D8E8|nr:hypothetical protein [Noviherbaspirillum saxi]